MLVASVSTDLVISLALYAQWNALALICRHMDGCTSESDGWSARKTAKVPNRSDPAADDEVVHARGRARGARMHARGARARASVAKCRLLRGREGDKPQLVWARCGPEHLCHPARRASGQNGYI